MSDLLAQGIFSLLSAVVGGGIGLLAASKQAHSNELSVAQARFRAAFAPAIAKMRSATAYSTDLSVIVTHPRSDVEFYLEGEFPKQSAAVEEFRPFVPEAQRLAYQECWERYYLLGGSVRFFYNGNAEQRKVFFDRTDKLMSFAKPTSSGLREWIVGNRTRPQ